MSPGRRVLGIFAKWPAAGAAKTRLAAGDPAWGARVAGALLSDTVARFANLPARRVLVFSPAEAAADFAALARGRYDLAPQAQGDLGERLAAFVRQELAGGAGAVVLLGADSPTLPPAHVEQAFAALEGADVVLGPACDGGYYLLGLRRLLPLFERIPWSSSAVLEQTVARLQDPECKLALLPPWYDVDTPDDWQLLRGHVRALRRAGHDPGVPATEALLQEPNP